MAEDDFVHGLVKAVAAAAGVSETAPAIRAVEIHWRQTWGGNRVYVAKAPTWVAVATIGNGVAGGLSLRDAVDRVEVGERQRYRILSRRWSP